MYHTFTCTNSAALQDFICKYQQQENFMVFCKECHNYNNLWSCPPLQLDVKQFLRDFNYIYVVGVKIIYEPATIKAANTAEKIKEITMSTLREVKTKLADTLLALEQQIPGSVSLASGGCHLCDRCARRDTLPCRHPEKMRHSLESLGFDLTTITTDLLGIELKWSKDSLPEYYTLIHALLTKQSLGNRLDNLKI
ncbi:MAG TPA: DUF2284 domain-containing protein [Methylomusa anaerophila]|uniref:Metal-binding protein n=1 Tax=Methylomusa anaerophila TaxID=1930071 RepID=A0A348AK52_9FIRM|nr:DUF2284 domain-containing protein [Methylomusa anaerophila]BBB91450.1 hypothetical protein MAMMFC1_02134 [Methylomusa anaerophila]HML89962.1 DUF2284 domain-containing protein [Methylomusa anaerophila]